MNVTHFGPAAAPSPQMEVREHRLQDSPVLEVRGLEISFTTKEGLVRAVRGVSLDIWNGETLGLVGESGSGKSTLAYALTKYVPANGRITAGSVRFRGEEILTKSEKEMNKIRGDRITMVYQDPMAALNPTMKIGSQLVEVLAEHKGLRQKAARRGCLDMLGRVRMPDPAAILERYPHQLSGGQQQRVLIAMALLTNPALLILDEPTTGLDVTVEAAILDLIQELRQEFGITSLYISHNLGVVSNVSDRVVVMYAGELVESGPVRDVFLAPLHPYTEALFRCIPAITQRGGSRGLYPIPGSVPSLREQTIGCIFQPRCQRATERCRLSRPALEEAGSGRLARCFYPGVAGTWWAVPQPAEQAKHESKVKEAEVVLKADQLATYFRAQSTGLAGLAGSMAKKPVRAVDGVAFEVQKRTTLGIVGESGCGKTTLAKCIAGLVPLTAGRLEFLSQELSPVVEKRPRIVLQELQMIFQNPDSTLNPRHSIGEAIARPLAQFKTIPASEVRHEVIRLLETVQLSEECYDRLPHQLSGGEKQRVAIARAFAGRPALVLCDEPLSALDVSVQAAVLNLLLEMQQRYGTTMLFISHDLSVVHQWCDRVAVMYLGEFCEVGPTEAIFGPPYHPYTEALLSAMPIPDPTVEKSRIRLSGSVPSAMDPPTGCRFHTRCPRFLGRVCEAEAPPWRQISEEHLIRCHISIANLQEVGPVIRVKQ
jgi:peptide/nickel transport system ATP-binding protein